MVEQISDLLLKLLLQGSPSNVVRKGLEGELRGRVYGQTAGQLLEHRLGDLDLHLVQHLRQFLHAT